ncbi:hypothetical protein [Blautia intestinalis]|uniref:hypothetical protein n=1 Tax=Blautia intestinalis TaxID=2763028 RepID=UPI0022E86C88|nr:hypothetical protein [Blautia intestinalis]
MTIEKPYQRVRDIEGLHDHLIKIVEDNDERFSFEWGSCGINKAKMEIFDKENKVSYIVKIEPIIYDDNGDAVNL